MNVLRPLPMLAVLVAVGALRCQEPTANDASPTFDGRDVAAWEAVCEKQPGLAITELARGGVASLPMLRALLASTNEDVAGTAARAAEKLGAAAAPLVPLLVRRVRTFRSWHLPLFCANALAAIGVADRDGIDAMFEHVRQSDVPHLRQDCTMALAKLEPQLVPRLLAAVEHREFRDRSFAIEALVWLGDAAVAPLVAALPANDDDASVARDALLRLGWRAVNALEHAGRPTLAADALRIGAQQRCVGAEAFAVTWKERAVAVPRLPTLVWEAAYGHGLGCELFRATDGPRGFDVVRITLVESHDEPLHVRVDTTTLSRDRAFAVAKQLLALPRFVLTARAGGHSTMTSTNDVHFAVVAKVAADTLLEASFDGYVGEANVPDRFSAEVAIAVLREVLADAKWERREPDAADAALAAARAAAITSEEADWSAARKKKLAALLAR